MDKDFEEWWSKSEHSFGNSGFIQSIVHAAVKDAFQAGQRSGMERAVEIAEDKLKYFEVDGEHTMASWLSTRAIKKVIKAIHKAMEESHD